VIRESFSASLSPDKMNCTNLSLNISLKLLGIQGQFSIDIKSPIENPNDMAKVF